VASGVTCSVRRVTENAVPCWTAFLGGSVMLNTASARALGVTLVGLVVAVEGGGQSRLARAWAASETGRRPGDERLSLRRATGKLLRSMGATPTDNAIGSSRNPGGGGGVDSTEAAAVKLGFGVVLVDGDDCSPTIHVRDHPVDDANDGGGGVVVSLRASVMPPLPAVSVGSTIAVLCVINKNAADPRFVCWVTDRAHPARAAYTGSPVVCAILERLHSEHAGTSPEAVVASSVEQAPRNVLPCRSLR
jgi:hypothetical protein